MTPTIIIAPVAKSYDQTKVGILGETPGYLANVSESIWRANHSATLPLWKPGSKDVGQYPNAKRYMQLQFDCLTDVGYFAIIVKCSDPALEGVKALVDWRVLQKYLTDGIGHVLSAPSIIEGEFLWKNKGRIKLCLP